MKLKQRWWNENINIEMMLFPNCSTFDQERTAMSMRPNSTALAEMGSHLRGRSSHVSARIHQLSLMACGIVLSGKV
jgi:hypothetical protein